MQLVWCERAVLPTGVVAGVLIDIAGGRIASIGASATPPGGALALEGLTLPGLANGHSHAFHRALRGRTHGGGGDFWAWRDGMYSVAARLEPENYLALARATFAEMVLAGFTCVGEFHYVHHQPDGSTYADRNAMGAAIVQAAHEAGIRLTLLDACYLRGGWQQPLSSGQLRFSDGTAAAWSERVAGLQPAERTRIGAAIHSVRAVDADSIATVARFAAELSLPLHAHVSEQPAENDQVELEFGCSPTEILAQQGALSDRFTAVHGTHLDATDIGLLAAAGSTCCFCPTTERDLADGIGPSAELAGAGVALSIGSDQHAVIDPFEEMRGIEHDERLRSLQRGTHSAAALLTAATGSGYRSLGWGDGGCIAAGALADLTTVTLTSARLAGAPADRLVDAAVFAATAADVTDVIIGGEVVVRHGRHTRLDVAGELQRAIDAVVGG